MEWLHSIDVAVFRLINLHLANPVFDRVMPVLSGNTLFLPALLFISLWVLWKGTLRARACLVFCVVVVALGDGLVCDTLKDVVGRPRPFVTIPDAHVLGGRGESGSMPSSHTANWMAAALVFAIYQRRWFPMVLGLGVLVGFSRIYNGMHYPSDVLAGGLIGAGTAAACLIVLDRVWVSYGASWFPTWARRCPRWMAPDSWRLDVPATDRGDAATPGFSPNGKEWLRLGWLLIGALFIFRLWYIASGKIQLSEDEAYQWLWAKNPALSYYSKPPLIAYTQWLGTALWGDNAFGVRFFSPVLSAATSLLVLTFLAREVNARAGFWTVAALSAAPMPSVGSILMTIDPLNVSFWVLAMVAGWQAMKCHSTRWWLLCGLGMGMSFLAKYTALFQLLSWAVFFILWAPARKHLRTRGPWLALGMIALCTIPVLVWNAQNGWITVTHLSERGGLAHQWRFRPNYIWDFLGAEAALLNPVFFVAALWAMIVCLRRHRDNPVAVLLFSMGAPVFVFYALWTVRARVQPNWIAPAVVPMFMLMALHWEGRWQAGVRALKPWLQTGMAIGMAMVVVLHDTNLVSKVTKKHLPMKLDPLRRVRGWDSLASQVGEQRERLAADGASVFVITAHYGLAGQISFYLPEAKAGVPDNPIVYYQSSDVPQNQFFFWPGYQTRKGQNAIYVMETPEPQPPPGRLVNEFESVRSLGMFDATYRGRVMERFQFFECRNLR